MLIDSHCHLHDREYFTKEQSEEMIKRAYKQGVEKIVCIGTDPDDSLAACEFAESHKNVYWTYGVHPENSGIRFGDYQLPACTDKLVAIGEVGLDYHYDEYDRDAQIKMFEEMIQLAINNDLPVSFHVREAFSDFFGVVNNFPTVKGVVHSFTDSKKVLKKILNETNFYVGVNGLSTYSTLPTPPIDRILLETDAPFLAPVPYRGKTNEPAYIPDIAKWLANKLEISFDEVARITTDNVNNLFKLTK